MSLPVKEESAFSSKKILDFDKAPELIASLKKKGKKVGLCHGGFDLLHAGHMKHFESAKKLCDVLFVSLTSDRFVSGRKGSGRPVLNERLRAYSTACIEFVDYVVISDFEKGIEVIKRLKPSYYIKGPDFIGKTTPGITAEREAIASVGGEMKYTNDPNLSTTEIIRYVKDELDRKKVLIGIDRDGTLIDDVDFIGKNAHWKEEITVKKEVVDLLIYAKTKYDATFVVVSNQAGVARKFFDCKRVEEINAYLDSKLKERGISVSSWQYCPDVDSAFAAAKKHEMTFDHEHVKDKTRRKPSTDMLLDALKELKMNISDFDSVVIIGDRHEDKELADNLKAKFIDVKKKSYDEMVKELNSQ